MTTQSFSLPSVSAAQYSFRETFVTKHSYELGPNDSSIQRGDNEAGPDEMGSGDAQPTGDPTSFGGTTSISHPESDRFNTEDELRDLDGMETMEPTDGRLGLTDIGNVPADDWAADTGPTRDAEEEENR